MTPAEFERAAARRTIIATAIAWGMNPAVHGRARDPRLMRLLSDAGRYGLPALVRGDSETTWALRVSLALRREREVSR